MSVFSLCLRLVLSLVLGPLSRAWGSSSARFLTTSQVASSRAMKKLPKYLTNIVASMLVLGAFLVPQHANAQLGHFVLVSQGQIPVQSATTTCDVPGDLCVAQFLMDIGTGLVGTTTGAFAYITASYNTTPTARPVILRIYDGLPTYGGGTSSDYCGFGSDLSTSQNSPEFLDNANQGCGGTGTLVLDASKHYYVYMQYGYRPSELTGTYYISGAATAPRYAVLYRNPTDPTYPSFAPAFAIVADGFRITPTAQTTGLYLSGAQAFCNDRFSSSTNPISGLANDFGNAMCQALGYLFVPTPESLQQYEDIPALLQNDVPFSYYFDVQSIWQNSVASTTDNFAKFSIDFTSIDFASSTPMGHILPSGSVDFLSSTTMSKYLPAGMHSTLFTLMRAAIWVTLMLVVYRRIVPHKPKI